MGDSWSFKPNDKYKSTHRLVQLLVEIVAKGGNFLLNVGPQPDGRLPAGALLRMREIGDWMKVNSEAIYATRPIAPYKEGNVSFTSKGRTVYAIYVTASEGAPVPPEISFSGLRPATGSEMRLLGAAEPLVWRTDPAGRTTIEIPAGLQKAPPCRHAFVVRLTVTAHGA
jgi:alpha-L-fucosidase